MTLEDILIGNVPEFERDEDYFTLCKEFERTLSLSFDDTEEFLEGKFFQPLYDALVSQAKLETEAELTPFSLHFIVATHSVCVQHQPYYRMLSNPSDEDDWEYLDKLPRMLYESVNQQLRNLVPDMAVVAQSVKYAGITPRFDAIWE